MEKTELAKIVANCGVVLYDAVATSENGKAIYRVFITKKGGVNLDDCEAVSKVLGPIFDAMPPILGEYFLEVSSPGLERKLETPEHFSLSVGEMAKITLNDKSVVCGEILGVLGENSVEILGENGEKILVEFSNIKKAKTFIDWGA